MKKLGQVWLETVIYILIGLVLIGLVLSFVTPQINERKDKIMVEQAINSLNLIDGKIKEVIDAGKYNKRVFEFNMKKGELYIDAINNKIVYVLNDLTKPYSEPGIDVPLGRVVLRTEKNKKTSIVNLTIDYGAGIDVSFNDGQEIKKFNPSVIPYKFSIENKGIKIINAQGDKAYNIDITEI